jgi:DNA-binding IclR family transcriptional regulator
MRNPQSPAADGGMSSVANALRLLDLLEEDSQLRVVDVARRLDVGNSTAHRLLVTLRECGYLRQDGSSPRYTVGPAALRLARRINTEQALKRAATPHLEALCAAVNETVNLEILVGADVLFIASAEDRHRLRVAQQAGLRSPAYANAGGKVLLAALTDDEVRELLRESMNPRTTRTVIDIDELIGLLVPVRDLGHATNLGEADEGVHAIAVGVPDTDGSLLAAVAIAAPAGRFPGSRMKSVLPSLRSTAAAIAQSYAGSRRRGPNGASSTSSRSIDATARHHT